MRPLFSIVIACHNHEGFVRESIDSALAQRHASKEIIAVDDGSTDRTAEVLKTYGKSIVFAGLAVNGGAGAARNHGAALASGEYLVFLDGDDALRPEALDVYDRLIGACKPELILGRSAKCIGTIPSESTGEHPNTIEYVAYPDFFSKDRPWVYNTSSFIVRREALLAAGGWSTEIFYQDIQDLLNRLADAGTTVLVLAPETVWYRMHSTNAVRSILPFVKGIYQLLAKAKAGAYPGGKRLRARRRAWFGGLIYYWGKEALGAGLYRDGFALLASNGWVVVLAVMRRSVAWIVGRKHVERLQFSRAEMKEQNRAGHAELKTRG